MRCPFQHYIGLAFMAGALALSGCGDDDDDSGTLELAVAPGSINVAAGGSGTATVTVTRGGGYTSVVSLSHSTAPAGITLTFSPSDIPSNATTSTVDVAVAAGTAPASHDITITGEGDDVNDATATLTVVVVSADAGSFALSATPAAVTAAAGAAAVTSEITVTRAAPFAGPVDLTVTGAPANVTATVTPTSVTGTSANLSVQAAAAAVNGTYPLVVHGTGAGVPNATTTVNVTVTGGTAAGISFAFNPTPVAVTSGGASATSAVTITRSGGFTGAVDLALSGAPAGLTASVAPTTGVTGNAATITVQAGAAVAAGTYNLTLTGTGTGISPATGTLPVNVSVAGGGGSFTAAFCTADAPIWVAAQDGTGAWTQVQPTGGTSSYAFTFTSSVGGIAIVDTVGTGYSLNVVYASVAEFTALGGTVNLGGCGAKTVNGSVANVAGTEFATVALGTSSTVVSPALGTNFQLTDVADGPQDLVAARTDATTFAANRIILRRGQSFAAGGTIPVLDFNATESFAPATGNVTVGGLGTDEATIIALFLGTQGSTLGTISVIGDYTSASAPAAYGAVPAANLNATDLQQLIATAGNVATPTLSRSSGVYFRTPGDRTITMGAALSTPTVTKLVTGPNARPRVQLPSQADYNRFLSALYDQASLNRSASVFATSGYFGGAPATWDREVPDLSAAAGWQTTWGLQNGTGITWVIMAQGGAVAFLDPNIAENATFRSASVSSSTPLAVRAARASGHRISIAQQLAEALKARGRHPM